MRDDFNEQKTRATRKRQTVKREKDAFLQEY